MVFTDANLVFLYSQQCKHPMSVRTLMGNENAVMVFLNTHFHYEFYWSKKYLQTSEIYNISHRKTAKLATVLWHGIIGYMIYRVSHGQGKNSKHTNESTLRLERYCYNNRCTYLFQGVRYGWQTEADCVNKITSQSKLTTYSSLLFDTMWRCQKPTSTSQKICYPLKYNARGKGFTRYH